ncbi:MAG: PspA/IM30 family protein [Polyangiaceae bacterium]
MGFFERAHMVVSSNFNALLRRLEEPNKNLALLLEEMHGQILSAQRDLIRIVAESKRNETRADELLGEIQRWEKRAELAVRQGDDALAREALAQKRRLVDEQSRAQAARSELLRSATFIKQEVERMKAKRAECEGGLHVLSTRSELGQRGGAVENLGQTGTDNPFERLRGLEESIERTDAYAAAHAELDELLTRTPLGAMTRAELDERFAELAAKESAGAVTDDASSHGRRMDSGAAGVDTTDIGTSTTASNDAEIEVVEQPRRLRVRLDP